MLTYLRVLRMGWAMRKEVVHVWKTRRDELDTSTTGIPRKLLVLDLIRQVFMLNPNKFTDAEERIYGQRYILSAYLWPSRHEEVVQKIQGSCQ